MQHTLMIVTGVTMTEMPDRLDITWLDRTLLMELLTLASSMDLLQSLELHAAPLHVTITGVQFGEDLLHAEPATVFP